MRPGLVVIGGMMAVGPALAIGQRAYVVQWPSQHLLLAISGGL